MGTNVDTNISSSDTNVAYEQEKLRPEPVEFTPFWNRRTDKTEITELEHDALDDSPLNLTPWKMFWTGKEICDLLGINKFALRRWEQYFEIKFVRTKSKGPGPGLKRYRRYQVEELLELKRLLRDEGYGFKGAKRKLSDFTKRNQYGYTVIRETFKYGKGCYMRPCDRKKINNGVG